MPRIGIRELKAKASEIMRAVREDKARYIITYRGEPVGVLSPIDPAQLDALLAQASESEPAADVLAELDELSQQIGAQWKEGQSAVELLSEMRS